MSASYHSGTSYPEPSPSLSSNSSVNRFVRANTAAPMERSNLSNMAGEKLRSLSCEYIDNNNNTATSTTTNNTPKNTTILNQALKQLNETLDEYDESDNNSIMTGSSYSNQGINQASNSRPQKLNLNGSKVEQLRKNFMDNANGISQTSEIVKSVKFKDPPEKSSPDTTEPKEEPKQKLKTSLSTSNVDKPPKAPPSTVNSPNTSTFSFRTKFTTNKSKTIDFPDLLQSAIESTTNQQKTKTSPGQSQQQYTTASGKPIQSILRRSETPPSTKNTNTLRQTSIDSTESARETSIEKLLRTTSTSRPLMFNN